MRLIWLVGVIVGTSGLAWWLAMRAQPSYVSDNTRTYWLNKTLRDQARLEGWRQA